uniref:PrsW family glutamic-type intramembrane protease n=1 Tax=Aggregatilinea sp. TaxID=2806333 RepID=UPI002B91A11B
MSLIVTLIAYGIAIAIPLFTVYLFVTQDVFGTGKPSTMLISMGWGAIGAYGLALAINNTTAALGLFSSQQVAHISGPVIEEVLKAAILVVLVRRPQFRYLVDGALYGIAVGIGFALSENLFIYLPASGSAVLGTAIS